MKITKAEQELYFSMTDPHADWFSAQLIRLIMKADYINKEKLRKSFPELVEVVERYSTEPGYWEDLVLRMNGS